MITARLTLSAGEPLEPLSGPHIIVKGKDVRDALEQMSMQVDDLVIADLRNFLEWQRWVEAVRADDKLDDLGPVELRNELSRTIRESQMRTKDMKDLLRAIRRGDAVRADSAE